MIDAGLSLAKHDRVLVLAPHPDDESIATGGVLLRAASAGAAVRILYLTEGENNPWAQRATEGRWRISADDRRRWGARRRGEAIEALKTLGFSAGVARFMGFPDQRLTNLLADPGDALVRLAKEVRAWGPTVLFVPSLADRHPDHSATAVMAQLILTDGERAARPRVCVYMVHESVVRRRRKNLAWLALAPEEREAKRRAILCHASQLRLRRGFLLRFARGFERFELGLHAAVPGDPGNPLRLLGATHDTWSFALRPSIRLALDRATLLLISQGNGERNALSLPIPRIVGRAQTIRAHDGASVGEVMTHRNGAFLTVTIVSPRLGRSDLRVAKLELGWDRKLGVFDRWPWLVFGTPVRRSSRRPAEPVERLRSYARL